MSASEQRPLMPLAHSKESGPRGTIIFFLADFLDWWPRGLGEAIADARRQLVLETM